MVRGVIVLALAGVAGAEVAARQEAAPSSAPDPAPVEAEFAELHALLDDLPEAFGDWRGFCAPDPGSELAARLAVFPARFGIDPRTAASWSELQDHAQRVLEGVGDRGLPEFGDFQDVSAQMDRYVLLEVAGSQDRARAILAGVSTKGANGGIWGTAENSVVVNQRRSEEAERRGDLALALHSLHESVLDLAALRSDTQLHVAGEDLLHARYGLLLVRTGHADVGTLWLQDLARTRPGTIGGRLAVAELENRNADATLARARALACQVQWGHASMSCAVLADWTTDDPASMRWIAVRLPGRADAEWTQTVAFDSTAFELVRPLLEKNLESDMSRTVLDSLTLLHGLPGGAERYVNPFLDRISGFKDTKSALALLVDERLRWMHGGGPDPTVPLGQYNWRSISEDWKHWRQSTGARAHASP